MRFPCRASSPGQAGGLDSVCARTSVVTSLKRACKTVKKLNAATTRQKTCCPRGTANGRKWILDNANCHAAVEQSMSYNTCSDFVSIYIWGKWRARIPVSPTTFGPTPSITNLTATICSVFNLACCPITNILFVVVKTLKTE